MNRVQILGRVGQDPEVKTMQSGDKVANFTVAVSEKWKDKNTSEQKEKTEWIPVVIFGALAKTVETYVQKGARILIEGKFTTRSWEQDGQKKYKTEVVLQGFNGNLTIIDWPDSVQEKSNQEPIDDLSDEVPF